MSRCRPRSLSTSLLTWHQHNALWWALMGEREHREDPCRNSYTEEAHNRTLAEQLVLIGLLRLENDKVPGFRHYRDTHRGAKLCCGLCNAMVRR